MIDDLLNRRLLDCWRSSAVLRLVDEHFLDSGDLLSQHLVFFRQVIILDLFELYALLIDVFLPFDLVLVQALLLVPRLLHFSLDLLKILLHLVATALVVALQAGVLFATRLKLAFRLLQHLALLHRLSAEFFQLLLEQVHLLLKKVLVAGAHLLLLNRVVLNQGGVLLQLSEVVAATEGGQRPIILRLEGRRDGRLRLQHHRKHVVVALASVGCRGLLAHLLRVEVRILGRLGRVLLLVLPLLLVLMLELIYLLLFGDFLGQSADFSLHLR